jgi:hypothetical protein
MVVTVIKRNKKFLSSWETKYISIGLVIPEPLRENGIIIAEYRESCSIALEDWKNLALEKRTWMAAAGTACYSLVERLMHTVGNGIAVAW